MTITQKKPTKNSSIKSKFKTKRYSRISDFVYQFNLAEDIVQHIQIKEETKNDKLNYFVTSNKQSYNSIIISPKYTITHFLVYCILRFHKHKHLNLIHKYINHPILFPTRSSLLPSFNKCMYLSNFIYNLLENAITLQTFIKYSKPSNWGYNIFIDPGNLYHLNYTIPQKDLAFSKTLVNETYSAKVVLKYLEIITNFFKSNYNLCKINNLLSDTYIFYHEHKLDFNNKYILHKPTGLFIPKCHHEIYESLSESILENLLYKEIHFPASSMLRQTAYIFKKYRNPEQLAVDLENAGVTKTDFNDMIQSIKPLGFSSKKQYRQFIKDLARICATKFRNFTIKNLGSSTTFYSTHPNIKKKDKYFSLQTSDIDLNIIPNEDFENYKSELEKLNTMNYDNTHGVYINAITRDFFGEDLMSKFFKKWGQQEFEPSVPKDKYEHVELEHTILKRSVSVCLTTKKDLLDFFHIIKENKTCLPHFSTFIRNGKTLSYWNEHNKLITEDL